MGSLHHMAHLLSVGRFMTTIDLKPIHNEHSNIIQTIWFEWNSNLSEFTWCRLLILMSSLAKHDLFCLLVKATYTLALNIESLLK